MKMPWPKSGENESIPEKNTKDIANQEPVGRGDKLFLNFNSKQYDLDSVPREVRELIARLEIADKQLQLYQDSIELIALGRDTLISQINEKLIDIPSLND